MDKPRSFAPIIAAVLLLLPVLYVGSYLALVTPEQDWRSSSGRYTYRASPQYCATLFWPLERVDRRLRPRAWEFPEGIFAVERDRGGVEKERIRP